MARSVEARRARPRQPRQSVGGGKFIQKRVWTRFPLLKTTTLSGKLTFGDPFEDSGVVGPLSAAEGVYIQGEVTISLYKSNKGIQLRFTHVPCSFFSVTEIAQRTARLSSRRRVPATSEATGVPHLQENATP